MSWNFDETVSRDGTNCIKYDKREEVFGRQDIIPMWVADMDFKTPGFIMEKLQNRLNHEIFGYSFRPPEYFSSIQQWFIDRHSWKIEKEWICFTPGIVSALNLCTLAFTRPDDSVIVQPPVYFPFFSAVESHGRKLVYNQLVERDGRWTMDFDSLLGVIDGNTKMIIISNPHNPVGRAWSYEELEQLADICLRNNILIVADEIHCDLILPGFSHIPIANISEKISEITVTCVAPSKTFNLAGLSTSSVIISNPVLRKYFIKKTGDLHIANSNIFGTVASTAAYSEGHEWVDALMDYINMSGKELQDFFVTRAGVGMNEGSSFGPGGEGFMRMNLATTREIVVQAMEQIEKAVVQLG
jgi:cystathionine beta-lyase